MSLLQNDIITLTNAPSTNTVSVSTGTINITSSNPIAVTSSNGYYNNTINATSPIATLDIADDRYLKVKHDDPHKVCDENDCVVYTGDLEENMILTIHNTNVNMACLMCEKFKRVNMKEKLMVATAKIELKKI
jgi:hypothetical protein